MTLATHYSILQVVIPLLAAPLCVLLKDRRACWLLTMGVMAISLFIAISLLIQTSQTGLISYLIGGWATPWGIEYRVDTLSSYMLVILTTIGFLVLPFAAKSVAAEIRDEMQYLFYTAFLLCFSGLLGIVITGDAFNLFVFLEISSLSTYALVSLGKDHRALTAAYQYLIMGTLGATFYIIGIGLIYMMTGTLNMADIAARLPAVNESRTVLTALAFLTVGISLKLALFPLHHWLPNAYTYAPSAVSALLAGTATKVAAYILLRVLFTMFGVEFIIGTMPIAEILMILAMIAVLIPSMVAIFQENLKRLLAYSSIAQIGYIVLGISLGSVTGLTAGLVHMFNHAVIKSALFLSLGCLVYRLQSVLISDIAGVGKRMPWTMAAFVAGGVSLIGVPLTAGFISKWYLVLAALEKGYWPVVVVVLAGSLMAVIYIWRVVEAAYFKPYHGPQSIKEAPLTMLIPTWTLILINFYFGIDSSMTTGFAQKAATQLLGLGDMP